MNDLNNILYSSGELCVQEYNNNIWMDIGSFPNTTRREQEDFIKKCGLQIKKYIPASGYGRYILRKEDEYAYSSSEEK